MKRIQVFIAALLMVATVALAPAVGAVEVFDECQAQGSNICEGPNDAPNMVQIGINTTLYILGMVAVLMIVIGGLRYTTSNGNPAQTKSAKDTILYAVIGLVVAIMAFSIVNFVIDWF